MSLCPESKLRQSMSDAEFWEHVFNRHNLYEDYDFSAHRYDPLADTTVIDDPCPECGCIDACGYDQEGRPMIHVVKE